MKRAPTPTFICELPLRLSSQDERELRVRLDVARQAYNALLGECLRRPTLMRESRLYQRARKMKKGKERTAAFRAARDQHGFSQYALDRWATGAFRDSGLRQDGHLDAVVVQTLAQRAFRAAEQHAYGKRGRPRFRAKNRFHSVEGKSNQASIRYRNGYIVLWGGSVYQCLIDKGDPHSAHALKCRIKYVRLVRRSLNKKDRYYAQLVCEGHPYRRPHHRTGTGTIGLDPGPRVFGIAGADWGAQVELSTSLKTTRRTIRRLQCKLDRQRRANNPANFLPDGRIKPGKKTWHDSRKYKQTRRQLANIQRREAALRKTLQGQLANALFALGNVFKIEKNNGRWLQARHGKSVGSAAPGQFISMLQRKAASAGVQVEMVPARLALSQLCLCGVKEKKPLSQRVHACACGITVQRDIWSAWLARFAIQSEDGDYRLDAPGAQSAWSGMETALPAASRSVTVASFVRDLPSQSASGTPIGQPHLVPSRVPG